MGILVRLCRALFFLITLNQQDAFLAHRACIALAKVGVSHSGISGPQVIKLNITCHAFDHFRHLLPFFVINKICNRAVMVQLDIRMLNNTARGDIDLKYAKTGPGRLLACYTSDPQCG
jgi:hypothetical protein